MPDVNEWDLIWRLGLALLLSASIGLDRELRQKSAGLRTYTLVGLGSALFMLISKYGFFDVLAENEVVLDPSRVAAQIVSGIGFIGAGLIFVRRDAGRGLTPAAGSFLPVHILAPLPQRLPASPYAPSAVRVVYEDGRGILRKVLQTCTPRDLKVAGGNVDPGEDPGQFVAVSLEIHGSGQVAALAADLGEIDGVHAVAAGAVNEIFDA